ncbi:ABC transporter permease [Chloroflexota bacterium]
MRSYVMRRVLLMLPTIFLASLIAFFIIRFIPGSIIDLMTTEMVDYREQDRQVIEHALGLDVPVIQQYGRWIGVLPHADGEISGLLQGNLGISLWRRTPVVESILTRWPITLELGLMALIIAQLIALPLGIYSALRQDTWGDYISRSFGTLLIAVPYFWLGTMVIVFPSIWWGWSPPIMVIPFNVDPIGNLKMFILPAAILGMAISGTTMRMTRTMMLEVLRQDYIRTAWAKGLRERVVIMRHALKNTLIPVISLIGIYIPIIIGGTVIIEEIFGLPGIGRLLLDAVSRRDYTMVNGVLMLFAIGMVFINLVVDLAYGLVDPRIRFK